MPPDLRKFDSPQFGDRQRARLGAWLREAGWPRDHMGIAALEGYLVALIAWPVGVPPGAWLPPIWGERGWKVPTKIAARAQYEEFVALVVGFMREIDRTLTRQPWQFDSSVLRALKESARLEGLQDWGMGFKAGLSLGAQGLKWRSGSAGAAVRVIVANTSAAEPLGPRALEEVMSAVCALMGQRGSRGPLGVLVTEAPPEPPAGRSINAASSDGSRGAGVRPT
jgi:yecA family protein